MAASWSLSYTLGAKEKVFSWKIDSRGNIFIKRKFRHSRFPRIDKVSCSHLDRLHGFMGDGEWKSLANDAAKLYLGTEKDGIGRFLYRLRSEVTYAHLSSQLAAIFYNSGVWEWNMQKKGMRFLLLPGSWKEKTIQYYRDSFDQVKADHFMDGNLIDGFSENNLEREPNCKHKGLQGELQKGLQIGFQETLLEEPAHKIEQTKLSTFFGL